MTRHVDYHPELVLDTVHAGAHGCLAPVRLLTERDRRVLGLVRARHPRQERSLRETCAWHGASDGAGSWNAIHLCGAVTAPPRRPRRAIRGAAGCCWTSLLHHHGAPTGPAGES